ncbi:hypothetical protein ACIHFD_36930 [Nonomuraea sp. NPDC051941]|uniref:hypothetical protein n=1 Tax=Nonomuraea sp. NPDC051941 TaxID=3364373 RepID=UPI0037C960D7
MTRRPVRPRAALFRADVTAHAAAADVTARAVLVEVTACAALAKVPACAALASVTARAALKPGFYGGAKVTARADAGFRLSWPVVKAHGLLAVTSESQARHRGPAGRRPRCAGLHRTTSRRRGAVGSGRVQGALVTAPSRWVGAGVKVWCDVDGAAGVRGCGGGV